MQITPNEIDSIEEAGTLDNAPVKMIRTKGGFWIAVARPKGRLKEEAVAAGSHPAIVRFNLEKMYPTFQASLMKSEFLSDSTVVDKHSHFLTEELRKSGHDVYSVQSGPDVEFHITKHNTNVHTVKGHLQEGAIVIDELSIPKQFSRAIAGATVEKALATGASKIKVKK